MMRRAFLRPSGKFRPQFNEMIELLQFCKLLLCSNESVKEWMGRLGTVVVECKYKDTDRQFKELFIHGLNYDEMLEEVIRELTKCWKDGLKQ